MIFLGLNMTKVIMFTGLGLLNRKLWVTEVYLLPLMVLGGLIGKWFNSRIEENQFKRWIFVLILVACIKLILF